MNEKLDIEIGCYILSQLFNQVEYDMIDAFSVIHNYIPANYICSRECYAYI